MSKLSYENLKKHDNPVTDLVDAYGEFKVVSEIFSRCASMTRKDLVSRAARILLNPYLLENPDKFGFVFDNTVKACGIHNLDDILKTYVTVPVKSVFRFKGGNKNGQRS